jgi:hypothetical protein
MIEPQAAKRGIAMRFPRRRAVLCARRPHPGQAGDDQPAVERDQIQPAGGIVIVQCAKTRRQRVRISVRDTGAGLSPEQLGQLFQPFNRLGQEDGGAEEGTGIGLVVTKQLVELMGGLIGVASKSASGTVFWVEFARAPRPAGCSTARRGRGQRRAAPTNGRQPHAAVRGRQSGQPGAGRAADRAPRRPETADGDRWPSRHRWRAPSCRT